MLVDFHRQSYRLRKFLIRIVYLCIGAINSFFYSFYAIMNSVVRAFLLYNLLVRGFLAGALTRDWQTPEEKKVQVRADGN